MHVAAVSRRSDRGAVVAALVIVHGAAGEAGSVDPRGRAGSRDSSKLVDERARARARLARIAPAGAHHGSANSPPRAPRATRDFIADFIADFLLISDFIAGQFSSGAYYLVRYMTLYA